MRWLLTVVSCLVACGGAQGKEEQTSLIRGSRIRPANIKASENRPHPWDDEKGPFQADRLEVQAYAERLRQRHREGHSKQIVLLEGFSHPACSGLSGKHRTTCPLLAVRWTKRREVAGGVVLEAPPGKVPGPHLQRQVLCHVAFGQVRGEDDCPLHLERVRARVVQRESRLELTIVTDDPSQVETLRRRVKVLVPTR